MPRRWGFLRSVLPLLGAAVLLWGVRMARGWLEAVEVVGMSMAPTLLPGDRLLAECVTLSRRAPRPGDVVLAHDPRHPDRELVKRVAAVDHTSGTVELTGDAPDASTDSRTFGAVPAAHLRWRMGLRYWPVGRIGLIRQRRS